MLYKRRKAFFPTTKLTSVSLMIKNFMPQEVKIITMNLLWEQRLMLDKKILDPRSSSLNSDRTA